MSIKQIDFDDLQKRVEQFYRMELPGQPMMLHMGTGYLIHDLWRAVEELYAARKEPQP